MKPSYQRTLLSFVGGIAYLLLLSNISKAIAQNPDHIKQLLETKKCPGCDLANAKLEGADLENADLEKAN